jgi:hypothetical protein
MILKNQKIVEIERGSNRWHSVENALEQTMDLTQDTTTYGMKENGQKKH